MYLKHDHKAFTIPSDWTPNDSQSDRYLAATTPFFILGTLAFFARIYARTYPKLLLKADDLVLILAYIDAAALYAICIRLNAVTGARHVIYVPLPKIMAGLKLSLWNLFLTLTGNAFVKISIVLTLLRIPHSFWLGVTLWMINFLLVLILIANLLFCFLQCRPISAFWTLENRADKCWPGETVDTIILTLQAFFVAIDGMVVLLPIYFILNMYRPRREKIILVILVLGAATAMGAGIAKIVYFKKMVNEYDFFYEWQTSGIWAIIQLFLGLTGACIATLKEPFDRLLVRFGVDVHRSSSSGSLRNLFAKDKKFRRESAIEVEKSVRIAAEKRTTNNVDTVQSLAAPFLAADTETSTRSGISWTVTVETTETSVDIGHDRKSLTQVDTHYRK